MSKVHLLTAVQRIPVSLDEAWRFFSSPANLAFLTPASLRFTVISKQHGDVMYPGQVIEYTVRPILGVPLYWMTEITHVADKKYFIDEQRFGPYSFWHHQHHFKEIDGGVEMTDIVHYKVPYGFVGGWANTLFVKRQLDHIFSFRKQAVEGKFGTFPA